MRGSEVGSWAFKIVYCNTKCLIVFGKNCIILYMIMLLRRKFSCRLAMFLCYKSSSHTFFIYLHDTTDVEQQVFVFLDCHFAYIEVDQIYVNKIRRCKFPLAKQQSLFWSLRCENFIAKFFVSISMCVIL